MPVRKNQPTAGQRGPGLTPRTKTAIKKKTAMVADVRTAPAKGVPDLTPRRVKTSPHPYVNPDKSPQKITMPSGQPLKLPGTGFLAGLLSGGPTASFYLMGHGDRPK